MPSNGSRPVYPQQMSWAEHQSLGAALLALREATEAAMLIVYQAYGKSAEPYQRLRRSLQQLDLARGHLSSQALTEHSDRAAAALSTLYFPERGP